MKWIFFHTPDYEFYREHICSALDPHFDVRAILIPHIELSSSGHHFNGISLKLELVCNSIEENRNEYIVFSDATIHINKNKVEELKQYMESKKNIGNDIMFVHFAQDNRNIGIMLIKCNDNTLQLFKDAMEFVRNKVITWDQGAINHLMDTKYATLLKSDKFESNKIVCGSWIPMEWKETFLVFKITIGITFDKINDFNQRFDIMLRDHLITLDEYDRNIKRS